MEAMETPREARHANAGRVAPLAEAVDALLRQASPAAGYAHETVGVYRVLCRRLPSGLAPLLLAAADGALYVPRDGDDPREAKAEARPAPPADPGVQDGASGVAPPAGRGAQDSLGASPATVMGAVLRDRRARPAGGTLIIRFPPSLGGQARTCALWSLPAYLAAQAGPDQLWK
jgi:hypothetical protein